MNRKLLLHIAEEIERNPNVYDECSFGPYLSPMHLEFDGTQWEISGERMPCSILGHVFRFEPLMEAEIIAIQKDPGMAYNLLGAAAQRRLRLPDNIERYFRECNWPPSFFHPEDEGAQSGGRLRMTAPAAVRLCRRIAAGEYDEWNRLYDTYSYPYIPPAERVVSAYS